MQPVYTRASFKWLNSDNNEPKKPQTNRNPKLKTTTQAHHQAYLFFTQHLSRFAHCTEHLRKEKKTSKQTSPIPDHSSESKTRENNMYCDVNRIILLKSIILTF